jgi:hypothetical protein
MEYLVSEQQRVSRDENTKNHHVLAALIIAAAMVVSAIVLSVGLAKFGRSLEVAATRMPRPIANQGYASTQSRISVPSPIKLQLVMLDRHGNPGPLRIETASK